MKSVASGYQRSSVTVPTWPEHLVPCCVDMATARPFVYALDVIHLTDHSVLDYYPIPRRFTEEVAATPQGESSRRLSLTKATSVVLAMGRAGAAGSKRSGRFAAAVAEATSESTARRKSSVSVAPPQRVEKVEVFLRPVGQVTMSAVYGFSEPNSMSPGSCDGERMFQLRLPNQVVYLKPVSTAQCKLLVEYISKWLRIAATPYFCSRVIFLVIDFTVTTSDALNNDHGKKRKDFSGDPSAMQFKSAAVALGLFKDAKLVVAETFTPTPQVSVFRTVLNGTCPAEKRRLILAVPFSFGSLEAISIGLKHETLGWLTPSHSQTLTMGQIVGQHGSAGTAFHMPLFIPGTFQGKVRAWASVSWSPDQSLNISVACSCKNVLRPDMTLPDPACFVSLMSKEKEGKLKRGRFVHFSEVYRNRKEAQFAAFSLSFPIDVPAEYQNTVNFLPNSLSQPPGIEKHLSRTFHSSIAVSSAERDFIVTENDAFQRVEDHSNLGNDVVYPAVTQTDTLLFEVLDGHYDVNAKDCIPASIGSACVSLEDLLTVAGEADAASHEVALLSYALRMHAPLQITETTPVSTLERLREKQKSKYPMSPGSFVFLSSSEASENATFKVDKGSAKIGACELGITKCNLVERPTFLQFLHSNEWDFGSMIFVDLSPSSLRSQKRGTISLRMPAAGDSGSQSDGALSETNLFEMIIVMVNRMMAPFLIRGGSDLYGFGAGQEGATSVFPIHQYAEAFGFAVDETTSVDRRAFPDGSSGGQHHHHDRASGRAAPGVPPFPSLRDWSGELTLPAFRSKKSAVTAKNNATDNLSSPEGMTELCPVLKRAALRATALTAAREAAVDRGAAVSAASFQVVTVVVQATVTDALEAAHLLASYTERPLGFILVFMDDPAPLVFGGVPNCLTVDFQSAQPKVLTGLAFHRQLRTFEDAVAKVPSLFLTFARTLGIKPSARLHEDTSHISDDSVASVVNEVPVSEIRDSKGEKEEMYRVEKKKFVSASQRFRMAFGGKKLKHESSSTAAELQPTKSATATTPSAQLKQQNSLQANAKESSAQAIINHSVEGEELSPSSAEEVHTHARIADVYVTEEEYTLLELESMKQMARQRSLANSAANVAASFRGRSQIGRVPPSPTAAPSTVLLDDLLLRKHIARLIPQKGTPETDLSAVQDEDIVAVVIGRQETVNATEVAVMLQCELADATGLLASGSPTRNNNPQAPISVPAPSAPQPAMTSSPKTVAPLADVEVAESEDDLLEEGRLSPMEKRRKRSKDDLDRIVGEALKPMYGGQFQERSLTDEETESRKLLFPENDDDFAFDPSMLPDDKLLTKSKEDGNPKILKPVERYHLYQAARPVQEALRLRTAGLTAASVRCKALQLTPTRPAGRPSSAPHQLASSGGTAKTKKTATSVAHPPYSAQPPRPIVDEKSSKGDVDGRCQELAPEKQKLLNDLLLPGQVFRGGPILIPEIARQQQEATEQRMQREAKLREERMKAMIAAAPQRAKERQKKLQQWKAAFRKANAPVDEVENDVLPC